MRKCVNSILTSSKAYKAYSICGGKVLGAVSEKARHLRPGESGEHDEYNGVEEARRAAEQ